MSIGVRQATLTVVPSEPSSEDAVRCVECDLLASGPADRWRAFVVGCPGEPVRVLVYCPVCAEREFGTGA